MVLVRAWLRGELEDVLQVGANSPPVASSRFRSTRRHHVQCIEVDEACNALKINDGETMVWCFVTTQGMNKFVCDRRNPSFASLSSKTITIDDWEFSSTSVLCSAFDEKKAKTNGHICILINKFALFGGERTTTIGKPSDLGEWSRHMRAILRMLSTPRDLVQALARGQGLIDLRDIDGVVMNAPGPELQGLSWEDVEPALVVVPVAESELPPPPAPAGKNCQQQPKACAGAPSSGRSPAVEESSSDIDPREKGRGGGESVADNTSQQSLGMDYDSDGEFGGGEDEFHTQAPSAGNVFSQEELEMQPASPTPPSPPSPGIGGGGGGSGPGGAAAASTRGQEKYASGEAMAGSPGVVPQLDGVGNACDEAPIGQQDGLGGKEGQAVRRGGEVAIGKGPSARRWHGNQGGRNGNREEDEEGQKEDESCTDPIPPGFTQLEVFPGDGGLELSKPQRNGEGDDGDENDEEEQIRSSRQSNAAAGLAPVGATAAAAASKGKGREKGKGRPKGRPGATAGRSAGDRVTAPPAGMQAATAGGSGKTGGAATEDSLSPEDILSPQVLSGGTSSSSNIGFPSSSRLGLSCLTQKRQNEGRYQPNSGARIAAQKCDIRSVFRTGGGGGSGSGRGARMTSRSPHGGDSDGSDRSEDDQGVASKRRRIRPTIRASRIGSSSALDREGTSLASTPDTVEMYIEDCEDALKPSAAENAAKKLPSRPLLGGSLTGGRKRSRPLSDILVAVDPAWDGNGQPPIVARGADADKLLAEWLDAIRPITKPPHGIADWLDKFACGGGGVGGGGDGGGSSAGGGGSRAGGGGSNVEGRSSRAGGGWSSARGGWRC